MFQLHFEKLYHAPRIQEPCEVAVPLPRKALTDPAAVRILQDGRAVPLQSRATSVYEDGSVRYLYLRFEADLPANHAVDLTCDIHNEANIPLPATALTLRPTDDGYEVATGAVTFAVRHDTPHLFSAVQACGTAFTAEQFTGPALTDARGTHYAAHYRQWRVVESGSVCVTLSCDAILRSDAAELPCEVRISAYAGHSWLDLAVRLINATETPLTISDFTLRMDDPQSCDAETAPAGLLRTTGLMKLPALEAQVSGHGPRLCVGTSNYKTDFELRADGQPLEKLINADFIMNKGNEHFAEVLFGTFFGDRTTARCGICATVFQAYQNFPKAIRLEPDSIAISLVPSAGEDVTMQPGMAREQRFQLFFHAPELPLAEIDNRSLIYQMPDRPTLAPAVFEAAGVMPDIFLKELDPAIERALIAIGDGHARCFGMLN